MQRDLYASILKKDLGLISGTDGDKSRLLNMVMQVQLKRVCERGWRGGECVRVCARAYACMRACSSTR